MLLSRGVARGLFPQCSPCARSTDYHVLIGRQRMAVGAAGETPWQSTIDAQTPAGENIGAMAVSPLYLRSEFGGLHVRCEQPRKTLWIAARHPAFGGYAVDPSMAVGGGEASSVASRVITVNETEIKLGF